MILVETPRSRWETRYAEKIPNEGPSDFLVAHAEFLRGRVLDVAAGAGRNTLFLARRGHPVDAVDIALAALRHIHTHALAESLDVRCIQADLEHFPLPFYRYDAIVNVRYLQRSLFDSFERTLRPGGLLIFETFLCDERNPGTHHNPAHLLQPDELRVAFAHWQILHYEEGCFAPGSQPDSLVRMVARRPTPD